MNTFDQIKNDPASRRAFLQRASAAGLGVAAVALLDGCGGGSNGNSPSKINPSPTATPRATATTRPTTTTFPVALPGNNVNEQVLNFALTLELLEADLYRQALNLSVGRPTDAPLGSSPGAYPRPTVGSGGINANAAFAYLRDFAFVEMVHVDFLQATLNSMGATVANGRQVTRNPKGYTFGPFAPTTIDLKSLLTAIYPLEEEGVSAYLGAAPFLTNLGLLQAAVSIYSTEARHSAAIAYILGKDTGPSQSPAAGVGNRQKVQLLGNTLPYGPGNIFEYFIPPATVVQNIQPLIVK